MRINKLTLIQFKEILRVENEKVITGLGGVCVDQFFCPMKIRKCRILGRIGLGEKYENGTYSGILGNFIENKNNQFFYL